MMIKIKIKSSSFLNLINSPFRNIPPQTHVSSFSSPIRSQFSSLQPLSSPPSQGFLPIHPTIFSPHCIILQIISIDFVHNQELHPIVRILRGIEGVMERARWLGDVVGCILKVVLTVSLNIHLNKANKISWYFSIFNSYYYYYVSFKILKQHFFRVEPVQHLPFWLLGKIISNQHL